jgi:hypothetical protein
MTTLSVVRARREAPTDRRTPITIARGTCPVGQSCYCCPEARTPGHGKTQRGCPQQHPVSDRVCSPPIPKSLPPCPERGPLPIDPPAPPEGMRPLHFEMCSDCGRVTARRWTDPAGRVLAWCAGDFPAFSAVSPNQKEATR